MTMVLTGRALTSHILPNTSFLQALVASLVRVLIMTRPGMVNLPVMVTSFVQISARLLMIEDATVLNLVLGAFIAVFMGAMLQVG